LAGHSVYIKEKKTKAGKQGVHWPEKKRMEVVATYLATGSNTMTSAITGVPTHSIEYWKRQQWWKKALDDLQYEDDLKTNAKLEQILNKSYEAVLDRLENGDVMYDPRTGKHVRIPAKLRDVHKVTTDMIDKKNLLRKTSLGANKKEEGVQLTGDHLVQLAQAFSQMALGKQLHPKEVVTEIVEGDYEELFEDLGYTDAIPEEREEKL